MSEKQVYNLKIDEKFKQLIPPLSSHEQIQLKENIVQDGCREPLCVWNDTIVDGHNRYEICTQLAIPFYIQPLSFNNREEVIAWICANQLGRRNISDETRRYLIGKRYQTEKNIHVRNPVGKNQHAEKDVHGEFCHKPHAQGYQRITAEKLGNEYRINERTVRKYAGYAKTIDDLSKKDPELISKVLTGKVKISYGNISKLSQKYSKTVTSVKNQLNSNCGNFAKYSESRNIIADKKKKITVKDMPAYDPDSEISSLTLTIPSWDSSINRILPITDFNKISANAKIKLQSELKNIDFTINAMLLAIEESL